MSVKIVFMGVDDWNRPTFIATTHPKRFFCDISNLFDYDAQESEVLAFYKEHPEKVNCICYKGSKFHSEPDGTQVDVEIISREEYKMDYWKNEVHVVNPEHLRMA
ncbi:MAG: hypothetical protein PUF10_02925 [Bacteroidales bacterium]|nr:hypothetical protein [Bacteroidales bacterium]